MKRMTRKQPQQPVHDDGWRLPDELWAEMEPLLPPRPPHPLGCHNPRVPDRAAMDAIFFVLRTGCQWNALNQTTLCTSSSAHRRFQEWVAAGVFETFWCEGLLVYDELAGIDWSWLALDGAMGKAPLGGEKNRPQPDRSRQARGEALAFGGRPRHPALRRRFRRQHERSQADAPDPRSPRHGPAAAQP
jgi:transposase